MDKNYITNGVGGSVAPVLAISAGSATTIKTTNAFVVKIDGTLSKISAATLAAIPATITVPLVSTSSIGIYLTAAGVASYVQGATVLNSTLAANTIYATSNLPQEVPGKALIGFAIISCASAATFLGGTTALDATNVTVTYLDKFGFVGL